MPAAAVLMTKGTRKIILIASLIMISALVSRAPAWCANLVGMVSNNRGEPVSGVSVSVVNSAGGDSGKTGFAGHSRPANLKTAPRAYKPGSPGAWGMSFILYWGVAAHMGRAPHTT